MKTDRDREWLRQHAHELPDAEPGGKLVNEKGSRRAEIGGTANSRTADAKAMAFAADMQEAARAVIDHPGWTSQTYRAIWRSYVEHGGVTEEVVAEMGCSKSTVGKAVKAGKALMLVPVDEVSVRREVKQEDHPWTDAEGAIELGCQNAHRAIVQVKRKSLLTEEDVSMNALAVRTLIASRESERKYLELARERRQPADDEEVRAIAGRERV